MVLIINQNGLKELPQLGLHSAVYLVYVSFLIFVQQMKIF